MTNKRGMRRVGIVAAISGAAIVAYLLLFGSRDLTVKVDTGPVGESIVARGVVVPSAGVAHVFAAADGSVQRVLAREGDIVEAGQLLAEIDSVDRNNRRQQLLAPSRGVVLARHVEAGDYVLAAAHAAPGPMFELADPTQTELRVEVEEADAASLELRQSVAITASGSRAIARGVVARVSARLERRVIGADDARVRADGMVRVASVAWTGTPPSWPIGARAEAVIAVRQRAAQARVPRSALSVRDGRTWVERPALVWNRAVPVEVVAVDDAYAEIRGVLPGTEVVVHTANAEVNAQKPVRIDSTSTLR